MKNIIGQEIQLQGNRIYYFEDSNLMRVDIFPNKLSAKIEFKRIAIKEPKKKMYHPQATVHYTQLIICC